MMAHLVVRRGVSGPVPAPAGGAGLAGSLLVRLDLLSEGPPGSVDLLSDGKGESCQTLRRTGEGADGRGGETHLWFSSSLMASCSSDFEAWSSSAATGGSCMSSAVAVRAESASGASMGVCRQDQPASEDVA